LTQKLQAFIIFSEFKRYYPFDRDREMPATKTTVINRLRQAPMVLKRYSLLFCLHLLMAYTLTPAIMKLMPIYVEFYRKVIKLKRMCFVGREMAYWRNRKEEIVKSASDGYKLKIEELGLTQENLELIKEKSGETVIAEIDQDGYLLSHYGLIKDAPTISKEDFMPRKKTSLHVVMQDGYVGVKKNFHGNKLSFVNELNALYHLAKASCRVPSIMDVNFEALTITVSYILGSVLRERLVKKGALIRDRDSDNPGKNEYKNILRGRKILYDVINEEFAEKVYDQILKIHRAGFIWKDIKYGNIIIDNDSGNPFLIDFEHTYNYPGLSKVFFRIMRDGDTEKFNMHFDSDKLTYNRIRLIIKHKQYPYPDNWYAPTYFGDGLKIGFLWNPDLGHGRWHYILKKHIPSSQRILDLGANNAFNAIQALRYGAQKVIGVEINEEHIVQGKFIKEVFEWLDNKAYDFECIHSDMKKVINKNFGQFDLVMALCSIYYLDEADIERLIQYISTISDIFILQANIDRTIHRENPDTFKKASTEYLHNALKENGFPETRVITPAGYSRPLIIGRRSATP
jgi:serine/threonine protein kinase